MQQARIESASGKRVVLSCSRSSRCGRARSGRSATRWRTAGTGCWSKPRTPTDRSSRSASRWQTRSRPRPHRRVAAASVRRRGGVDLRQLVRPGLWNRPGRPRRSTWALAGPRRSSLTASSTPPAATIAGERLLPPGASFTLRRRIACAATGLELRGILQGILGGAQVGVRVVVSDPDGPVADAELVVSRGKEALASGRTARGRRTRVSASRRCARSISSRFRPSAENP